MSKRWVKSKAVWQWPEWQAFAARLGIPMRKGVTDCVVTLKLNDVVRFEVGYLGEDASMELPCPQQHSDTPPVDSPRGQQGEATTPSTATSVDTPEHGDEQP